MCWDQGRYPPAATGPWQAAKLSKQRKRWEKKVAHFSVQKEGLRARSGRKEGDEMRGKNHTSVNNAGERIGRAICRGRGGGDGAAACQPVFCMPAAMPFMVMVTVSSTAER